MAKRKAPENETPTEKKGRQIKEAVANTADRSAKTSWNRKLDKMIKLLGQLRPIEEQIIELQAQKVPIFDDVQKVRNTMVKECVHPFEYLSLHDDHVTCKFCDKRIGIPSGLTN